MGNLAVIFIVISFVGIFLILPFAVTICNFYYIVMDEGRWKLPAEILTWLLGPLFSLIYYTSLGAKEEWNVKLHVDYGTLALHTPVSSNYMLTVILMSVLGVAGYFLARCFSKRLSPLLKVLSISCMYLGCILSMLFMAQMTGQFSNAFFLCLFPLNYIFLVMILIKRMVKEQVQEDSNETYTKLKGFRRYLYRSSNWPVLAFFLLWPLAGICMAVLALFGQEPSSALKAFTETSDWLLSQRTSPPTTYSANGHYLCTVAATGHKGLVKPMRWGERHGNRITVNRQLCIANAFEQLLEERLPLLHRGIREFYDAYGYPLSKHIHTRLQADLVYLLMKPLEWFFLFIIYIIDKKPEERIEAQYLPSKEKYGK